MSTFSEQISSSKAVIIVTHDRTLAQKADDVLELRDGQVVG